MYNFGQFRRTQLTGDQAYITNLQYTITDKTTVSPTITDVVFKDKKLSLSGRNFEHGTNDTKNYYVRFKIQSRTDGEQKINIKLVNSNSTIDNNQNIKTVTIPQDIATSFYTIELVICPNSVYNTLEIVLERKADEYKQKNSDGTYGRVMNIIFEKVGMINNVITQLNSNLKCLKQIGIQSSPGLQMCINGEKIQVGKSGLYEIRNGLDIYFIGFLIDHNQSDNDKYFILDYQY